MTFIDSRTKGFFSRFFRTQFAARLEQMSAVAKTAATTIGLATLGLSLAHGAPNKSAHQQSMHQHKPYSLINTLHGKSAPMSQIHPRLTPVLADREILERLGATILAVHEETDVAYSRLTDTEMNRLSELAHEYGKCGGFEALPYADFDPQSPILTYVFGQLSEREAKNRNFRPLSSDLSSVVFNTKIDDAIKEVSEVNLRDTVTHLSGFSTRFHRSSQPNQAVESLKSRIEAAVRGSSLNPQIELISHSSTSQKSLRARIEGSKRPNEVIVLGAHLDSINQEWFGPKHAPGADDNASGSANLVEALRILARQERPERSIEIYWYAGEEGGLLGSAEIARQAKTLSKDVIAALQLDMTLFPGDGEFTLGSMTDFTSAWLRGYLESLNRVYIHAKIIEDKCGYGCSDHASWHRQGYPALMPFEASFNRMNQNLHTTRDVIDSNSNFRHSAMFTKIAVALAMDLGSSSLREAP
jgi:leucyl aminopeptidase